MTIYNSGTYPTCKFTSGFTAGQEVVIGGTYDGSLSLLSVYRAGRLENSRASTGNGLAAISSNSLQFVGGTGGTVPWDGSCSYFYWDTTRALSDAQMLALMQAPYDILQPIARRIYFDEGAGGGPTAYEVDAQPGTFSASGTAATLARGLALNAQPGAFAVNGTAATLARGLAVNAQPGTFAVNGTAATLEKTTAGAFTIDAQPGIFSISGTAATLAYGRKFDAQPGTFSLSGTAATLTKNAAQAFELDAQPGAFALTGTAATLTYNGASIWTDVGASSTTWSDRSAATTTWSDL